MEAFISAKMGVNIKIFILLSLLFLVKYNRADNYVIVGDEMSFFQPCAKEDNGGNTNVKDMAEFHLSHDYASDMETIFTNGNVTILMDLPEDQPIELSAEIYKWQRGIWEKTVFSVRRSDFCAAFMDPQEIWHQLVMQWDEKDRFCPPKKGTIFQLQNATNRIEFPNVPHKGDFSGKYKAIIYFNVDKYITCIFSVVNIWKNL